MFGGGTSTEYDDIVNKTTDENLTSENWELILNLCDKVQDEGQTGAHDAIAAILKRLAHRNPNVQLYALSLTESLSKNLGIEIHRELASRAFTQGLEKLITDRNTHEKVRRRALGLIALWTAEFEKDESLGIMEDCYNNLKAKNYKFEQPEEPAPPTVDDDIRRKEEEELQRVLEMSMQDRGGRSQWAADYSLAGGSSSSGGAASGSSSSGATVGRSSSTTASHSTPTRNANETSSSHPFAQPKYQAGGYVPARTPSPGTMAAQQRQQQMQYHAAQAQHAQAQVHSATPAISEVLPPTLSSTPAFAPTPAASASASNPAASSSTSTPTPVTATSSSGNIITRVRALHTFEATEPGELAFEQGDIIKVVDRGYKDWWRGQLKGRTGIFPVNYVEAMPEPTAAELAKEAEQEAAVFSQAVNVEKLLNMLRALDPAKDNLADNEEIQELYRASMALRPKIVKLIDKYSQKRADLVSMNETFVRARNIFDRMMEESLARHTAVYDQPYRPSPYGHPQGRPTPTPQQQQPYGWNTPGVYEQQQQQPGYSGYPGGPAGGYNMIPVPQPAGTPGLQQQPPQQQGGYVDPAVAAAYGGVPQQQQPQQQQPQQQQQQQVPQQQQQQPQQQVPQQVPAGYGVVPQGGYAGHQPGVPYTQQGPTPYPTQQQGVQPQPQHDQQQQQQFGQPQQQQAPQQLQQPIQAQPIQQQQQPIQAQPIQQQQQPVQIQVQSEPIQVQQQQQQQSPIGAAVSPQPQAQPQSQIQPQLQAQPQSQSQAHPQPQPQAQPTSAPQPDPTQPISGPPPYVYNPAYTYADPNVQAWAQYYAQGGKDLAGAVYFVAIPGVTEPQQQQGAVSPQRQGSLEAQGGGEQTQQQPQRQQSYQAQAQAQPQQLQPQAQPVESEFVYSGVPAAAAAARAVSPSQAQQLPNSIPRYQLQDQPLSQSQSQSQVQPQVQPQYANQYQLSSNIIDTSPKQASPTSPIGLGAGARPGTAGSYHSPTQSASTPSWVLPKKATPGPGSVLGLGQGLGQGQGHRDAAGGQAGGESSYFPLSDPGSGAGAGGAAPASGQNHQGVGLPA